jgi:hypothetical protein
MARFAAGWCLCTSRVELVAGEELRKASEDRRSPAFVAYVPKWTVDSLRDEVELGTNLEQLRDVIRARFRISRRLEHTAPLEDDEAGLVVAVRAKAQTSGTIVEQCPAHELRHVPVFAPERADVEVFDALLGKKAREVCLERSNDLDVVKVDERGIGPDPDGCKCVLLAPRPRERSRDAKVAWPEQLREFGLRLRVRSQILEQFSERRQPLLGAVDRAVALERIIEAVLPGVQVRRRCVQRIVDVADPPDPLRDAQLAPPANARAVGAIARRSSQEVACRIR